MSITGEAEGENPLSGRPMTVAWLIAEDDRTARERWSRWAEGTFVEIEREAGKGRRWPPGRNEPCWSGSERKYKRCCGAPAADTVVESAA